MYCVLCILTELFNKGILMIVTVDAAQGTNVASGKARGVVIGTGQRTEIGRVI